MKRHCRWKYFACLNPSNLEIETSNDRRTRDNGLMLECDLVEHVHTIGHRPKYIKHVIHKQARDSRSETARSTIWS